MTACVLDSLLAAVPGTLVCSVAGGDKRNAIPRECVVTVAVSACLWGVLAAWEHGGVGIGGLCCAEATVVVSEA